MPGPAIATLKRDLARSIAAGHPWLYQDAILLPPGVEPGTVVLVQDRRGRPLALGIADPASPIAVRIWTNRRGARIDDALIEARVATAAALRHAVVPKSTDTFRLLHGEGDRTPGVVCDIYGDTAVLRPDTLAVDRLLPAFAQAIARELPAVRRVVRRDPARGSEGERVTTLLGAPLEGPLVVREHGLRFEADPTRGHKTGLYLDQRENRARVRALAAGRSVLNLFSYTGGFSVAAAVGGATSVTTVDTGEPVIEAAKRNFALNGLDPADPRWRFAAADAFAFLEADPTTYDLIIVDPPSMAPSAAALDRALSAYRRVNELALRHLAPRGLLLTASCSSHVSEQHLCEVLRDAARASARSVRILEHRGTGPDHPVLPAFPEGRYLSVLLAFAE